MKQNHLALLIIIAAAIIGGGSPVFLKISLEEVPPLSFTFLRFLLASLFMIPLFFRENPKFDNTLLSSFLISLLAVINILFFAFGIMLTDATISQTIYVLVPITTSALSFLLLNEQFNRVKIFALVLGFIGALLVTFTRGMNVQLSLIGNFLIVSGMICFALYSIYSKKMQKKVSPNYLNAMFVFSAAIILIPFFFIDLINVPNWWQSISNITILGFLYVSVIATFLYYLLYQYAIKHSSPTVSSIILYLQPVTTFIWAMLLLEETLSYTLIMGAILVFVSAWVITKNSTK
jgi:drug/metabolite transporter (DMT)-like permease